ncbi:MAG TPA: T9SS type A sorting domain-containing protein [Candidatus Kapabacteria bacterium]|nr:T9SS type A sorting domain-containing protein [Candidatus Kapabacteria bacterium]
MKTIRIITTIAGILLARIGFAQHDVGPIVLDSSFALNGISETDFNGHDDKVTAFDILGGKVATDRAILVGGKVTVTLDGQISFGMIEYTSTGILNAAFGDQGRKVLQWPGINYPKVITAYPNARIPSADTMILAAGASAASIDSNLRMPALFRFKNNGDPDSNFGINGRIINSFDDKSPGECTNTFRTEVGYAVACGYNFPLTKSGFGAFWVDRDGKLDSNYGNNGKLFLHVAVSYAIGYFTDDLKLFFVGLSTDSHPEIILAKLTEKGLPDSSFGSNGVMHSGITLKNGNSFVSAYLHSTFDNSGVVLLAAPLEDSSAHIPFTLIAFKAADGTLDSAYGNNGFVSTPVFSNLTAEGIVISNDGSALVAARASGASGQCAVAKIAINGDIDSTFGNTGVAIVDAFDGSRENYLLGFNSIGGKKFIGVGVAQTLTGANFLVTRYRQLIPSSVNAAPANKKDITIFPNPVSGLFYLTTPADEQIDNISIFDQLGNERILIGLSHSTNTYIVDGSELPSGCYFCRVSTVYHTYSSKVIIAN